MTTAQVSHLHDTDREFTQLLVDLKAGKRGGTRFDESPLIAAIEANCPSCLAYLLIPPSARAILGCPHGLLLAETTQFHGRTDLGARLCDALNEYNIELQRIWNTLVAGEPLTRAQVEAFLRYTTIADPFGAARIEAAQVNARRVATALEDWEASDVGRGRYALPAMWAMIASGYQALVLLLRARDRQFGLPSMATHKSSASEPLVMMDVPRVWHCMDDLEHALWKFEEAVGFYTAADKDFKRRPGIYGPKPSTAPKPARLPVKSAGKMATNTQVRAARKQRISRAGLQTNQT